MSKGKGSSQSSTSVQQIDPMIRAESQANMNLARDLAGLGYNPYEGATIADFSEGQKAAFSGVDAASAAFGMPTGASSGLPTGAIQDDNGVFGFSPQATMENSGSVTSALQDGLDTFYATAAKDTPMQQAFQQVGGDGKK